MNNVTGIGDIIENRDEDESPLPPDANFTEEELSILDDIDLNDSKDVLQNVPSNASILFPDDIPCSSPWVSNVDNRIQKGDRSPSVIENTPDHSPFQNRIIENYCDITPVPSPYNSFAPSPVNFQLIDSPAVASPASDINDITYSPSNIAKSRKRISQAKKDKGRLRERFHKKWKDQERKYNVNRGLEYVSRNGRVHDKKIMKSSCPATCRKKCSEKLTENIRQRIFDMFWSIGDHSRQWDFLASLGSRQGYCFSWHQQTAKRGANEISSCVFKFIEDTVGEGVKDYRFWSDNCGGQNRNRIVFLMYMIASSKFSIDISHRFLIVGHTQNEGDSMHALIERQTKDKMLYTPDQWYTAFRFAKSDEKPYKVIEVSQDLIKDFKSKLRLINNWTTTNDGSKMPWNRVTEVVVKAENPFRVFYKTTYQDDAYKWIDCVKQPKATRNRRESNINIDNISLAYQTPIPIDKNKYKDLMDLCKKLVIPKEYHLFFNNLIPNNSNRADESDSD
ncbi:unnamed protein product [Pieris macdunnoughi]|uniref:DUF7869 domain-containing protein n=1 Tax=Pieris macdunnoughi TaxID=345717 RepID=A0A821Q891_9NEOP|nr:unnamed protein product [Pieris macdunnoughi]